VSETGGTTGTTGSATAATTNSDTATQGAGVRDHLFRSKQDEQQPNGFKGA